MDISKKKENFRRFQPKNYSSSSSSTTKYCDLQLMGSVLDKDTYQNQRFSVTQSTTFTSKNMPNDFSKQFATYWSPASEKRYENWLKTQRDQFDKHKGYDKC
ncbi:unnamed protein product [Thelazia callipaeda]|uniref:Uncharacterized protein n=1 Tax=Thelazia callipaeda TaxID=103827 RepID=A0A0N5D5Q4_THECL|nr:unnamed protein product [Thelazia callipaeda]